MTFLKGLFGTKEQPPEWAEFFTASDYHYFIELVHVYFQSQGVAIVIDDGVVHFQGDIQGDTNNWSSLHKCGLLNIAQTCRQNRRKDWREIVFRHFDMFRGEVVSGEQLEEQAKNFYLIYDLLAVRLWPETYMGHIGEEYFIYRRDMEGVITSLAYDLPNTIRQVRPEDAAHWNKPVEELFEIGLSNVRKKPRPEISNVTLEDGITVTLFAGDSFFVSSWALLLQDHPTCIGSYGSLIGVPTRNAMICYPIHDLSVVRAIRQMIAIIAGMHHDGPGSISPYLYWYHESEFTTIPYEIIENKLSTIPPESFVELLNSLSERKQ